MTDARFNAMMWIWETQHLGIDPSAALPSMSMITRLMNLRLAECVDANYRLTDKGLSELHEEMA